MIDWEEGCIPLVKHKANARKGKRRVIYLTDESKAMLREMCRERPEGPLFVTRNGIAYNRSNIIGTFRRLERWLGIPKFNPYSYRHTYITEALERGLSSDIVAELVGNTPKTIAKYYSHLESKKNTLRSRAAGARLADVVEGTVLANPLPLTRFEILRHSFFLDADRPPSPWAAVPGMPDDAQPTQFV